MILCVILLIVTCYNKTRREARTDHSELLAAIPDDIPEYYTQLIKDCWSLDPDARPNIEVI